MGGNRIKDGLDRKIELDVVKGIGIIIMVIGHTHFSDGFLNHYIYAFHMPLFFVISGMLFRKNTLKEENPKLYLNLILFSGGTG